MTSYYLRSTVKRGQPPADSAMTRRLQRALGNRCRVLYTLRRATDPVALLNSLSECTLRELLRGFIPAHGFTGSDWSFLHSALHNDHVCPLLLAVLVGRPDLLSFLLREGASLDRWWGRLNLCHSMFGDDPVVTGAARQVVVEQLVLGSNVSAVWSRAASPLVQSGHEARDLPVLRFLLAAKVHVDLERILPFATHNRAKMLPHLLSAADPSLLYSCPGWFMDNVASHILSHGGTVSRQVWTETVRLLIHAGAGQFPPLRDCYGPVSEFFQDVHHEASKQTCSVLASHLPLPCVLCRVVTEYARGVQWFKKQS